MEHDSGAGVIRDGDIRYVILRADVLMGIAAHLPAGQRNAFLRALEDSAASRARSSFELYRRTRAPDFPQLLATTVEMSARLGWGRWRFTAADEARLELVVDGSPFAASESGSEVAVCAPIVGVLRAMLATATGATPRVEEVTCAARGDARCTFRAAWTP